MLATACLDLAIRVGIEVIWLGRSPALDLIKQAYPHLKTVEMPRSTRPSVVKKVIKSVGPVKLWVDLQANVRSRAYLRLASKEAQIICAPKYRRRRLTALLVARLRRRLFPKAVPRTPQIEFQYQSMVQACAAGLTSIGVDSDMISRCAAVARPNLHLLTERKVDAAWGNELNFGRWLALAPGAAYQTKQSPLEVWLEVLANFKHRFMNSEATGLLIIGGTGDRKVAVRLLDQIVWPWPVLNLTGKLSLADTATAVSRCELLLTNDSGLLHIAEAVGTPVCALFGPTVEEFGFAPWREDSLTVSSDIGCRPCSRHGKAPCRYDDKLCFQSLPTYVIHSRLDNVFSKQPVGRAIQR